MIVCLLVGFVRFGLFGGLVIGVFFSVVFNYNYVLCCGLLYQGDLPYDSQYYELYIYRITSWIH